MLPGTAMEIIKRYVVSLKMIIIYNASWLKYVFYYYNLISNIKKKYIFIQTLSITKNSTEIKIPTYQDK